MKKIYILLLVISILGISCSEQEERYEVGKSEREVEINLIHTTQKATRATDQGSFEEREIKELDLLIFNSTGHFLYSREAFKLVNDKYRATLLESSETLTVYFLANCRSKIAGLKDSWTDTSTWTAIQNQLIDTDPARLVNSTTFQPLPMFGKYEGEVLTTGTSQWGPVLMLRSVASADLYVEQGNPNTSDFELTDMYVYYAPDKGYLPALEISGTDPQRYEIPTGMKTSLTDQLHATQVKNVQVDGKDYKAIAHQMYIYDNDAATSGVTNDKKFSRVIMAGYYKGNSAKSYYPIDFVNPDGSFRNLIRNWKYDFKVTGVFGPGYKSPEEAAKNYPIDVNTEVIAWNNEDVMIGVGGQYYVSLEKRKVYLDKRKGFTDIVTISYDIKDNVPGDKFTLKFSPASANGPVVTTSETSIKNDFFRAILVQDTDAKKAELSITALENYNVLHHEEVVIVRFRNLEFEIDIVQVDEDGTHWDYGEVIELDL